MRSASRKAASDPQPIDDHARAIGAAVADQGEHKQVSGIAHTRIARKRGLQLLQTQVSMPRAEIARAQIGLDATIRGIDARGLLQDLRRLLEPAQTHEHLAEQREIAGIAASRLPDGQQGLQRALALAPAQQQCREQPARRNMAWSRAHDLVDVAFGLLRAPDIHVDDRREELARREGLHEARDLLQGLGRLRAVTGLREDQGTQIKPVRMLRVDLQDRVRLRAHILDPPLRDREFGARDARGDVTRCEFDGPIEGRARAACIAAPAQGIAPQDERIRIARLQRKRRLGLRQRRARIAPRKRGTAETDMGRRDRRDDQGFAQHPLGGLVLPQTGMRRGPEHAQLRFQRRRPVPGPDIGKQLVEFLLLQEHRPVIGQNPLGRETAGDRLLQILFRSRQIAHAEIHHPEFVARLEI